MIDAILSPEVIALGAVISWVSAVSLVWAARHAKPRVGALTERAIIAVLISTFLTMYAFVAWNTNAGYPLFDFDAGLRLLRGLVLLLSLVSPLWLVLWLTGRLGDGGKG